MRKSNRIFSITMLIIMALNLILPSCVYGKTKTEYGGNSYVTGIRLNTMKPGEKRTLYIDGEQLRNGSSGSNSILLDIANGTPGVYKIGVEHLNSDIPFAITSTKTGINGKDGRPGNNTESNRDKEHSESFWDYPLALATCGNQTLKEAAQYGKWVQVFLASGYDSYTLSYWATIPYHEYLKVNVEFVGNTNITIYDGDTNADQIGKHINSATYSAQGKNKSNTWTKNWFKVYFPDTNYYVSSFETRWSNGQGKSWPGDLDNINGFSRI